MVLVRLKEGRFKPRFDDVQIRKIDVGEQARIGAVKFLSADIRLSICQNLFPASII